MNISAVNGCSVQSRFNNTQTNPTQVQANFKGSKDFAPTEKNKTRNRIWLWTVLGIGAAVTASFMLGGKGFIKRINQ